MKLPLTFTLSSFLLFAFITKLPLAFSDGDAVLDTSGNPVLIGRKYFIVSAKDSCPGGGLRLGKTGDSKCSVTVIQDYSKMAPGTSVTFRKPDISTGEVFTGDTFYIELTTKPDCAESSKWLVFVDNEINKSCVGIGGPENYPGKKILSGTFQIQRIPRAPILTYKLVFCDSDSLTCTDIGRFNNGGEEGRRLVLDKHEPFELSFVVAAGGVIKSVA